MLIGMSTRTRHLTYVSIWNGTSFQTFSVNGMFHTEFMMMMMVMNVMENFDFSDQQQNTQKSKQNVIGFLCKS